MAAEVDEEIFHRSFEPNLKKKTVMLKDRKGIAFINNYFQVCVKRNIGILDSQ